MSKEAAWKPEALGDLRSASGLLAGHLPSRASVSPFVSAPPTLHHRVALRSGLWITNTKGYGPRSPTSTSPFPYARWPQCLRSKPHDCPHTPLTTASGGSLERSYVKSNILSLPPPPGAERRPPACGPEGRAGRSPQLPAPADQLAGPGRGRWRNVRAFWCETSQKNES